MHDINKISAILDEIEQELQVLEHWGGEKNRPHEKAFLSTAPFCIDTMDFHQWLEYVLVAKMRQLIKEGKPLPKKMLLHPVAQEYWRGNWAKYRRLIGVLRKLDECFK